MNWIQTIGIISTNVKREFTIWLYLLKKRYRWKIFWKFLILILIWICWRRKNLITLSLWIWIRIIIFVLPTQEFRIQQYSLSIFKKKINMIWLMKALMDSLIQLKIWIKGRAKHRIMIVRIRLRIFFKLGIINMLSRKLISIRLN